ncbi:MAG: GDP-mannose 4,6-dehydratase, partial [Syntrophothermus sp.]
SMAKFGVPAGEEVKKPKLITVKKSTSSQPASGKRSTVNKKPVLITGGAGFIGTNLAHRLLNNGESVIIFDNLSRPGVEENLQWLLNTHGERLQIKVADIRNPYAIKEAVQMAGRIYHFAAQVAVTISLDSPVNDFEINLQGTINLLEAVRALKQPVPLLFTSTNKVYGGLPDVAVARRRLRYEPVNLEQRTNGISEFRQLDFHSPYGCSKGAADQYVIDYARIYNMPNVVFRMSCIYGPHQFGTEDQGWVAFFLIKAMQGEPITVFGDGYQVRDILYVEDLVDAQLKAHEDIDFTQGQAFNIGGGPENTVSLLEVLEIIEELTGRKTELHFSKWRQGDQKYYVSNTQKYRQVTGWYPKVNARDGIEKLFRWFSKYRRQAISENKVKGLAQ